MKNLIHNISKSFGFTISKYKDGDCEKRKNYLRYLSIYRKYADRTMIPQEVFIDNLSIAERNCKSIEGAIVECGVWKGGMSGGLTELFGKYHSYFLFDSFEGLPEAKATDGEAAISWQNNKESEHYYNNCYSAMETAQDTMSRTSATNVNIIKGWFNESLPKTNTGEIALLRLDGDWYESTKICLEHLFPKVVDGGIIIIDDYFFWDGCAKAVHEYLVMNNRSERIHSSENGVAFVIKNEKINRFNPDA